MSKVKVDTFLNKHENNRDFARLASQVYNGTDKALSVYLIQVGLETCASKMRATARRGLRANILKPAITQRPGGAKYSVKLSDHSRRKLTEATLDLFRCWKIGNTELGDATREKLLSEAKSERASGKGHVRNAVLYEALAEPMNSVETCREHWQSAKAVLLIQDQIWKDTEHKEVTFVPRAPELSPTL